MVQIVHHNKPKPRCEEGLEMGKFCIYCLTIKPRLSKTNKTLAPRFLLALSLLMGVEIKKMVMDSTPRLIHKAVAGSKYRKDMKVLSQLIKVTKFICSSTFLFENTAE